MKELLAVIPLLIASLVAEPPSGPYSPSGWRPDGPAFDLPQRGGPQNSYPSPDPRGLQQQYGVPNDDVSVQGLPVKEQDQLFVVSPIAGQQYVGPNFNADIRNLDQSLRDSQFQKQQQTFRQLAKQREQNTTPLQSNVGFNGLPNPQIPRDFQSKTTTYPTLTESSISTTESPDDLKFTQLDIVTTDSSNDDDKVFIPRQNSNEQKQKTTSVEITKQNIQEVRPELLLSPLIQLNGQSQGYSLQQLGQIRAPVFYESNRVALQRQVAAAPITGYDGQTHLAGLQSILSQRQLVFGQPQGFAQNPNILINRNQDQTNQNKEEVEQIPQNQQQFYQTPFVQQPQAAYNPQVPILLQNQPQIQYLQPQLQQTGNEYLQPNLNKQQTNLNNDDKDDDSDDNDEGKVMIIQPQIPINPPIAYQPQNNQFDQQNPSDQQYFQSQNFQNQQTLINPQLQYQQNQPQLQYQPQDYQQNQPQLQYQPQDYQQNQPQLQYQPQGYQQNQPQLQYQPQEFQQNQPQFQYQPQEFQRNQLLLNQQQQNYYQQQGFNLQQQQVQFQQRQSQDSLQSGLNVDQHDNGIEQSENKDDDDDGNDDDREGQDNTATAVATSFGTRTSPRVFSQYGAPLPKNKSSSEQNPASDSPDEEQGVAVANAVSIGGKRRNAKLRNRRIRPVFTLDRSGHLVLANRS